MSVTLGVIGCGNMGSAIVHGLAGRPGLEIVGCDLAIGGTDLVSDRVQALSRECGTTPATSNAELADKADLILVAVKPHQVKGVLEEIAPALAKGKTVVSIAAGVTMAQLREWCRGACPVVRVMPNTPAMVGKGQFALCLDDPGLDKARGKVIQDMLGAIGQVFVLPESLFDAFTAVAGSGPAYVFYFMEAMAEAGVLLGLPRDTAVEVIRGLFQGSAALAARGEHLAQLREWVCSPAGTTIAAIHRMDAGAVRASIVDAARAACARSKELGKQE